MLVRVWRIFRFLEKYWSRPCTDLFLFVLYNLELLFLQFFHCYLYLLLLFVLVLHIMVKKEDNPVLVLFRGLSEIIKKPLFIIKDVLFLYKICINVRNNFEKPNCVRVLENHGLFYQKLFPGLFVICRNLYFFFFYFY